MLHESTIHRTCSYAFVAIYWSLRVFQSAVVAEQGGFLAINRFLQSAGGPPEVFAAGDVATSVTDPRPKAGVFAVRQGQPLADNLRRCCFPRLLLPLSRIAHSLKMWETPDNGMCIGNQHCTRVKLKADLSAWADFS